MLELVPVTPHRIASLFPIIGDERRDALVATATAASERLAGRIVLHVNSTATGGGVAEMLPTLVGYAQQVGVDARWAVVPGNPPFFDVTKRVHNRIHGHRGDDGQLGSAERRIYEGVLAEAAPDLLLMLHPGDVVVLHDPQTLGVGADAAPRRHRHRLAVPHRVGLGQRSDRGRLAVPRPLLRQCQRFRLLPRLLPAETDRCGTIFGHHPVVGSVVGQESPDPRCRRARDPRLHGAHRRRQRAGTELPAAGWLGRHHGAPRDVIQVDRRFRRTSHWSCRCPAGTV